MKTHAVLLVALVWGLSAVSSHAQAPSEHDALNFLVGAWKTVSTDTQDVATPGDLTFEWMMEGHWLKCTFVGHRADGRLWEAYALFRYQAEAAHYKMYLFYPGDAPLEYEGQWLDETTLRFEGDMPNGVIGIDYQKQADGTVYQENWVRPPGGTQQVSLKTTYEAAP